MRNVIDRLMKRANIVGTLVNGSIREECLFVLLFTFEGTISFDELTQRIFLYILPYWEQSTIFPYNEHYIAETVDIALKRIQTKITEILPELDNIDETTAQKVAYSMVEEILA